MKYSKGLVTAFFAVACGMGLSLYYVYYNSPAIRNSVSAAVATELSQHLQNKFGPNWTATQLTKIETVKGSEQQVTYVYSLDLQNPWQVEIIDKKMIITTSPMVLTIQPENEATKADLLSKSEGYLPEIKGSTQKLIQDEIQSWIDTRFGAKKDYTLEIILR